MKYKGYHAKIEFDEEDMLFIGKVLDVDDSLNFHGTSVDELEKMFHQSIDNYLDMCAKYGKKPIKKKCKEMDKKRFVKAINSICQTREFEDKLKDLYYKYSGSIIIGTQSTCIYSLIAALAIIFEDQDRWIDYYVFELDCGKKYRAGMITDKNGNNIDLSTPETLYEFLIDNKEGNIQGVEVH